MANEPVYRQVEELVRGLLDAVEGELEARAELESLRLSELLARANALGLEEEALDAQDADDPKAAVIELLLRAASG